MMRLNPLYLVATGVLILCTVLVIRQPGETESNLGETSVPKVSSKNKEPVARPPTSIPQVQETDKAASTAATTPVPPSDSTSPASSPSQTDKVPPGIQLADDVRLPAVILAISAAENDTLKTVPAPIAAAMRAIVTTFYQDLAESARQEATNGNPDASAVTGEDTILIKPGPAVDRARARANETYRALFGDDAFNRMTMNAALETRLPVEGAAGGK